MDNLRLQDGNTRVPLRQKGYAWMEDMNTSNNGRGMPRYYAIEARELRLYPVPDRTYSLATVILNRLPEISLAAADTATNAWVNEGELLIRTYAQGDLMVRYLQGDAVTPGLALMAQAEGPISNRFKAAANREQGAGSIRARL
jgi:hypothetical protein